MDHLPEAQRRWVRRKLHQAWSNPDAAEAALKALARQLDKVNPDAGASLREGLGETLTVTRLGITGTLLKRINLNDGEGRAYYNRKLAEGKTSKPSGR